MINPKKDRLIYSDILVPPYGYELEKAVTTTYSLDIAALISCMIPLAFSSDVNDRLFKNRVSTFTALRNLSRKVVVFCDPGQIKELKSLDKNFAVLLENMIVPVNLKADSNGDYPAFHPKMWLLQFVNAEGKHLYRFIALSRNISYDRCYDVSFVLESSDNHLKTKRTKPVIEFLEYLGKSIDTEKFPRLTFQKNKIDSLQNNLMEEKVCFSLADQKYEDDDFDIYPLFDDAHRKTLKNVLFEPAKKDNKEKYDEMFVMSPFVSDKILEELQNCIKTDSKIKLVTRQLALESVNEKYNESYETYVLNDAVVLGSEFSQEDTDEESSDNETEELHDIHAKLYLTQNQKHSDLYIGSVNATYSAFNRNVELMVRIGNQKKYLNVQNFFSELNPEDNPLFEKTEIVTKQKVEEEYGKIIEKLIKNISHSNVYARVSSADKKYNVELFFENIPGIPQNVQVKISPFSSNNLKEIAAKVTFEEVPLASLSEFYVLSSVYSGNKETANANIERIIKIPTYGIPYELRDSEIVNGLIKDKDTFAEYVTLLLSRDYIATQSEIMNFKESNSKWKVNNTQSPLYEMLLKASTNNPEALKNLESDLKIITNKEIVSDEFRDMYEQFLKVIEDESHGN